MVIDFQARKDCYNQYESFGEICVGCGCCSDDPEERYKARIALADRMIEELEKWSNAGDYISLLPIQIRNIKKGLSKWEKRRTKFQKKLKELQEGKKN